MGSLFFFLPFLLFFYKTTTPPPHNHRDPTAGLTIRPGYKTYESYIQRQLNKTLNPKLRQTWLTRDWDRKVTVFTQFFQDFKQKKLLFNDSKSLSIGARVGQEVEALKRAGVLDAVGIDLVPYPPLVIK